MSKRKNNHAKKELHWEKQNQEERGVASKKQQ
jgi:hypothetical protein